MNNYELSRLIVDDVMKKVNAGEQVFYMEYVRSVESLLNKHAAQQSVQPTVLMHAPDCDVWISQLRPCTCGLRKSHSG